MAYVNLNLSDELIGKLNEISQKLRKTRSAYIREALAFYVKKTERELLSAQFKKASEKCREESLAVPADVNLMQKVEACLKLLCDLP